MKNVKIKLKTKFILSITSIVILFGIINIYLIRKITLESLGSELQRRGQYIANSLAGQVTDSLLYDDFLTLQQYIDEINVLDQNVGYVFVQDKNGQLLAHNFEKLFPSELLLANSLTDGKEMNVELIFNKTNGVLYRDIAAPIMKGDLGVVRVGLMEKSVTDQINRATYIFTAMVALFLVAGITGAFIFSSLITNPIYKIIKGFEQLNLDGTPKKIRVKTNDEIEYLVEKFNEMALRLHSAHNELLNTQEKLIHTEKLASIGTLVAGLAHEINNPLSGLKNCLNRIRKKPDPDEAEKYSDLMANALDKIERVVKGLLDFSRKGSDQSIVISINEIIGQSLDLVEYKLKKYNIKLVRMLDKELGKAMGDPYQMEQVMLNLMLNAIDSMLSGGVLTLKTSQDDEKIFIHIEDTGEGIPEKNLKKIFDPFFTTKGPGKGTGLGLAISYNFIKAHGGDISIISSTEEWYPDKNLAAFIGRKYKGLINNKKMDTLKMKVLIVDDEEIIRISLNDDPNDAGFTTTAVENPLEGFKILANEHFDVVVTDLKMAEMDGISFLKKIKQTHQEIVVIMMTAFGTINSAVEAMKLGAYDYIAKPFSSEELILVLKRIQETFYLKSEVATLKKQLSEKHTFQNIIAKSKAMKDIFDLLVAVSQSNSSVLITGETGTGKEMVAGAIHYLSPRKHKPYIKVSCAVLSKHLLENELFGHEKGAFTGALTGKKGRFELADGGSIFLDDVDDIPLDLQVKLLRALQEKEIERVGGTETKKVDVRVIAASKVDLLKKVKDGEFRDDLYYRLNVVPVVIPPLRDRQEDIPLLINAFVNKFTQKTIEFDSEAMKVLLNHNWPGNVRELENLVERLVITISDSLIGIGHLPKEIVFNEINHKKISIKDKPYADIMKETEIDMIKKALVISNGNKLKTAKLLKLKPSTLRSKIEKYEIQFP